jgi:hypothetical protein
VELLILLVEAQVELTMAADMVVLPQVGLAVVVLLVTPVMVVEAEILVLAAVQELEVLAEAGGVALAV